MNSDESLSKRIGLLERRVRRLKILSGTLAAVALIAATAPRSDVLRARGLVITDASGKDRIILAAPMREASSDPKLAEAVGLTVLDSMGRMLVAVGSNNPLVFANGQSAKRIATSAGLTIYDPRNGGERGGLGAFLDGRANMCLDWGAKSKEAACVSVAPGDQYRQRVPYLQSAGLLDDDVQQATQLRPAPEVDAKDPRPRRCGGA